MLPLLFLLPLLLPLSLSAQSEADYIRTLGAHLGGEIEKQVRGGRVDIETEVYAIEVERAAKWKNSIGQALWYSLQTDKKPAIILLVTDLSEYKYFQQLNAALQHAGLDQRIKVWAYPQDFPGVPLVNKPNYADPENPGVKTAYWLSVGSNKRHRRTCSVYEESKGRYCSSTEGELAGCCQ